MLPQNLDQPSDDEVANSTTVDLVSREPQLGVGDRGIIEAKITIGKPQVGDVDVEDLGALAPDPPSWAVHLLYVPFTLHELDGSRMVSRMRFELSTSDEHVTAYDLFPSSVTGSEERTVTFSLSPSLKFQEVVELSVGELKREVKSVTLVPEVDSFGAGESRFYWVHRPPVGLKSVRVGRKHGLAVLQVPANRDRVSLHAAWSVDVQRPYLGRLHTTTASADTRLAVRL